MCVHANKDSIEVRGVYKGVCVCLLSEGVVL